MSWTKRQLITEAFSELAIGSTFDVTAEEQSTALRRLDTMMATWEAKGVRIGYAFPASPDESDPDTDSGIPDKAAETVYLNLAMRLAPWLGKTLTTATMANARDGYDALLLASAYPQTQQLPETMPRGAGNRTWGGLQPFFPVPDDSPLGITQGGDLNIKPE